MSTFFYKAKKDASNTVTGKINANHVEEAIERIYQLGLVPVSVQLATEQGALVSDIKVVSVKIKEVAIFSRQLSGLLKSGVPLLRSLEILSVQTKHRYLSNVINEIGIGIKSGRNFSACLNDYPVVFTSLYVAMIKAGEEMGQLRQMLLSMSEFLRKQEEFMVKVRHALVYPAVMLLVGLGTVIFILTFVMPKVTVIFINTKQHLPWPTQVVMALSHFLRYAGIPILFIISVLTFMFNKWQNTAQGKFTIGKMVLAIPVLRDFILKADLALFTRTLQLLLESRLPIIRAIETAVPMVSQPLLRAQLLMCAEQIKGGESLGNALSVATLIEPMMVQQITVAEESGNLPEALGDLAQGYENDVDAMTKTVTALIEPLMIVGVGAIVGFMVFAMLMPIFSMDILAH